MHARVRNFLHRFLASEDNLDDDDPEDDFDDREERVLGGRPRGVPPAPPPPPPPPPSTGLSYERQPSRLGGTPAPKLAPKPLIQWPPKMRDEVDPPPGPRPIRKHSIDNGGNGRQRDSTSSSEGSALEGTYEVILDYSSEADSDDALSENISGWSKPRGNSQHNPMSRSAFFGVSRSLFNQLHQFNKLVANR